MVIFVKLTRFLWIGIAVLGIGWIYYIYISPRIFKPAEVVVPDIIGLSEEEARLALKKEGLTYNINYIDGQSLCVDSTMPKHGSKVYEGYPIEVYILKPLPSYYQSFVGLIYEENIGLIQEYCTRHELTYRLEYVVDNSYSSGQIIGQSKNSDEFVVSGTEIVFQIAVSDNYISMPNLVGRNIREVMELLDGYRLNYNVIYYHAPLDSDIVISQSVQEGTVLQKGNSYAFDIYVSKGMPSDISSLKIDDFIQVLNELEYNYDIIYVDSVVAGNLLLDIQMKDRMILYISK